MALTDAQKASRLFKKSVGAAETLVARDFFEEPKLGKNAILPSQIWSEADKIPLTAPTLTNGQTQGVVQYFEKLSLNHISGSQDRSYSHDSLKNTIPFNYSDGSYNYALYKSDGSSTIAFGQGDWLLDTEAGVLTFYGTLPTAVSSVAPPQISFYKYVGTTGIPSGSTSGLNVHESVRCATTGVTDATYSTSTSGYTSLPSNIDGITSFSNGDRILIKNQTTAYQNGLFVVSGSTLVRAADSDGLPSGEVSLNDYVFVTSGSTLVATSWVIGSSDTPDENGIIRPGIDTQNWILFSTSKEYSGDNNAIKLNGSIFYVDLDDTGIHYNSGLYQSPDGLRLSDAVDTALYGSITGITSVTNALTGITSNITSLSTALSSEILNTITGITSLETSINNIDISAALTGITSNITSLSTALSSEILNRTSGDTSLSTALSIEINNTITGITSLETSINNIDISAALTGITSNITSLSTALSTEILNTITGVTSLESVISTEINNTITGITSLETAINNIDISAALTGITSNITSLSTALSTEILNTVTGVTSLETAINNIDISAALTGITSNITSLSTALSTEINNTITGITSLETALDNFSGVTSSTAGSGLTFNVSEQNLNVAVDNYTIKIVNNELRSSQLWIQTDKLTTILTGTGVTNIALTYDPITPVQVFVNGIEYLVSLSTTSSSDYPFYFTTLLPTIGSVLHFDATEAGFSLESGIDLIAIKYQYIDTAL